MKREGRQHGMVRSYRILPAPWNPRPESRFVNKFDSAPTAGLFTKVPSKPTNHSKFTGKCGKSRCTECHVLPACKSKDKAKGTQKLRSCDVVSNYRLTTWRAVDFRDSNSRPGFKLSGFSASEILDDLGLHNDCLDDGVVDSHDDDLVYCAPGSSALSFDGYFRSEEKMEIVSSGALEIKDDDAQNYDVNNDDDDDAMSFCDVGFVWDQVEGDEDWCLVGEM